MIVIDASVAVEALLGRRGAQQLIFGRHACAPHLIDVEVVSVLRRQALGNVLTGAHATTLVQAWQGIDMDRYSCDGLLDRVWTLRDNLTVYDATYVALAERLDVPLVTADVRLANAPGIRCDVDIVIDEG